MSPRTLLFLLPLLALPAACDPADLVPGRLDCKDANCADAGARDGGADDAEPGDAGETDAGASEECVDFTATGCDETGRYVEGSCANGHTAFIDCQDTLGAEGRCGFDGGLTLCTTAPLVPDAWTCDESWYGSGDGCDCGCGVLDEDCAGPSAACISSGCGPGLVPDLDDNSACVAVDPAWTCSADRYRDLEQCDCGCGVADPDCGGGGPAACERDECAFGTRLSDDALSCAPIPATSVDNPSFEVTPEGGEVPGWTERHIQGTADAFIIGQADTTAPDGGRALKMTSTYQYDGGTMGFPGIHVVASSTFFPPAGTCTATVAIGDFVSGGSGVGGGLRVVGEGLPANLSTLAVLGFGTAESASVFVPPADGYADASVSWTSDGATLVHLELEADAPFNTRTYSADDVRIACVP